MQASLKMISCSQFPITVQSYISILKENYTIKKKSLNSRSRLRAFHTFVFHGALHLIQPGPTPVQDPIEFTCLIMPQTPTKQARTTLGLCPLYGLARFLFRLKASKVSASCSSMRFEYQAHSE